MNATHRERGVLNVVENPGSLRLGEKRPHGDRLAPVVFDKVRPQQSAGVFQASFYEPSDRFQRGLSSHARSFGLLLIVLVVTGGV
jgi:hypothetical protein